MKWKLKVGHISLFRNKEALGLFSATFNYISALSWLSVLLMEETGGPREVHRVALSQ